MKSHPHRSKPNQKSAVVLNFSKRKADTHTRMNVVSATYIVLAALISAGVWSQLLHG